MYNCFACLRNVYTKRNHTCRPNELNDMSLFKLTEEIICIIYQILYILFKEKYLELQKWKKKKKN